MPVVRTRFLPLGRRYAAINLFGLVLMKPTAKMSKRPINHERIHTRQMVELLFVGFYLLYVAEWLVRLISTKGNNYKAYRKISFEKEAYAFDNDMAYLSRRKCFAQWRKYKTD